MEFNYNYNVMLSESNESNEWSSHNNKKLKRAIKRIWNATNSNWLVSVRFFAFLIRLLLIEIFSPRFGWMMMIGLSEMCVLFDFSS